MRLGTKFPISVKGVLAVQGRVVLLKNERGEWELPGGKLDRGETPEGCVIREVREELGIDATLGELLDVWVYEIRPDVPVVIVTFGVYATSLEGVSRSDEHQELGIFPIAEIPGLEMPDGYKRSVLSWCDRLT